MLFLAYTVDWQQAVLSVSEANSFSLLAGGLAIFVSYFFFGLRWHLLLKQQSNVSFWVSFRSLAIGHFFNAFLPLRAGDLLRIHSLKRHVKKDGAYIFGAILFEKLLDLTILLLMLIWIISIRDSAAKEMLFFLPLLSIVAIWLAIATVGRADFPQLQNRVKRANSPTLSIPILFIARQIDALLSFFKCIPRTFSYLLPIAIASIIPWFIFLSGYVLFLNAFEASQPILGAIAVVSATNLGAVIPSSPAGIGVYEGLCITALYPFGVALHIATAIAIVTHIIAISAQVLLGGISLAIEYSSTVN